MTIQEYAEKAMAAFWDTPVPPGRPTPVFGSTPSVDPLVVCIVEQIRAAVAEEREACAATAESVVGTFERLQSPIGLQGIIADLIRKRTTA